MEGSGLESLGLLYKKLGQNHESLSLTLHKDLCLPLSKNLERHQKNITENEKKYEKEKNAHEEMMKVTESAMKRASKKGRDLNLFQQVKLQIHNL